MMIFFYNFHNKSLGQDLFFDNFHNAIPPGGDLWIDENGIPWVDENGDKWLD